MKALERKRVATWSTADGLGAWGGGAKLLQQLDVWVVPPQDWSTEAIC